MTKIISDYFHQVDIAMGVVWQNNSIILILISLFQLIFCTVCALGFWTAIFNSKSYFGDLTLGITSFIEDKIKGLKGTFIMIIFSFFSLAVTTFSLGVIGYLFFIIAKMTHDSFVYNHELFIIFR